MQRRVFQVALLLGGSGACALVYQVAWLRELRLVFGASTLASAAVLAIFMGGLGLGSAILGKRADAQTLPLAFYGRLELAIAATAALTPGLIWLARALYVAIGGTAVLGLTLGTLVRLALSAIVLGVPTFLMGGTLPAAARAVEAADSVGRRRLALLYGINTLGAVAGTVISNFVLLEAWGTRRTLWIACAANVVVAITALALSKRHARGEEKADSETLAGMTAGQQPPEARAASGQPPEAEAAGQQPPEAKTTVSTSGVTTARVPAAFVFTAAAIAGFAFLLMELIWYRMLTPLLGGSTFTFGLILATALAGIGLGGVTYALWPRQRRPTLLGFAAICALEALAVAVPYILGDDVAVLALLLRSLGTLGFYGHVLAWSVITGIVVFPAAFFAGVQFPLLIALLGEGREKVGRHVGMAYAWNTAGSIVGSLAGGFGLLPLLGAPGAWLAVIGVLAGLAAAAVLVSGDAGGRLRVLLPGVAIVATLVLFGVRGPTAAWRHSPIGAGRQTISKPTPNGVREWLHYRRRILEWQKDGVESSVGLSTEFGYAFLINGKSDGHARADAATQVMGGLVGAILHPRPQSALVIGLGTGSTAGWLGAVPEIERVDVVELEPAVRHIAEVCAPVNRNVLANPKVHITHGDARELLLTTPRRYDIIFSEPSNPYRAGVASLFTQEFYRASAARLTDDGLFLQWLQAYEVDSQTIRSVYATMASEFDVVETWRTLTYDLLLVGAKRPIVYDVVALRQRIAREPFRSALANAWRSTNLEGFLAHFVARDSLARDVAAASPDQINTDDRNIIEFGFARSVGLKDLFDVNELARLAVRRSEANPTIVNGSVDWNAAAAVEIAMYTDDDLEPPKAPEAPPDQGRRIRALGSYAKADLRQALLWWRSAQSAPFEPAGLVEMALVAEASADAGEEAALVHAEKLRVFQPAEADAVVARLRWKQGRISEATEALLSAFSRYRKDPWPHPALMRRALSLALEIAARDSVAAQRLFLSLQEPFAVTMWNDERLLTRLKLLELVGFKNYCVATLEAWEPDVPWNEEFLRGRADCYTMNKHALAASAREDLELFRTGQPIPFTQGLEPAPR